MKMFKMVGLVLAALLMLVAPVIVPVQAQETTYDRWGGHFWAWQGPWPYAGDQEYIDFWAFRDVTYVPGQPPSPHSMMRLHLLGPGGATQGVLIAEDWIDVPGDQDWMSVSDDLGWAGIDTTVRLLDRNSGQMVRVDIHVYWWATGPEYAPDPISHHRDARVEGWIRVYGPHGFTAQLPGYYPSAGSVKIFTHSL